MYKKIIILLFLLVGLKSFSQADYIKNNATLWLKNDTTANCLSYNNNCALSELEENYKIYSNNFSFFIAFKSDNDIVKDIVSLKYGNKTIKVTNKNVLKQNDTIAVLDNTKTTKIVSYLHNDATFQKKGKLFLDLLNNQNVEGDILEIIFIPKVVSKFTKEKIETYLSLKYGFSLAENQYYRSVKNDTLWNPVTFSNFSKDVTGMGNDSENFFSNQKSYNHNLKGLEISTETTFLNNNYVLWGHNGKVKMIPNHNELSTANYKIWHFKRQLDSVDNRLFKLKIKKELLDSVIDTLLVNEKIYLYVSHNNVDDTIDLFSGQYFEGQLDSEENVVFNDINLLNDSRFIFIKAPEMNVFLRTLENCNENTQLRLDFINQKFPLEVEIKNSKHNQIYSVKDIKLMIKDLPSGEYNVIITDASKNKKTLKVSISQLDSTMLKLKETWELNEDNYVLIIPEIENSTNKLKYEWLKENIVVGTNKSYRAQQEGNYSLKVSNGVCEESYEFKVISNKDNLMTIYPNPAKINEDVFLKLNYLSSKIKIKVNDLNGRLIQNINRIDNQEQVIKLSFSTGGVFLISVETEKENKVFKIIIN